MPRRGRKARSFLAGRASQLGPRTFAAVVALAAAFASCDHATSEGSVDPSLEDIRLPEGFAITVWADSVPGARSLSLGPEGIVFVGTRSQGLVYAVADRDGDGRAEDLHVVASGLHIPNGVAYRDSSLYVAEINRVLRIDGLPAHLDNPPGPAVVYDGYPDELSHGWKFIRFGPDDALYVPVGAPCNVCESANEIFATITRLPAGALRGPGGGDPEIVARGVRNTVGFDWHPLTGELWFTDNGRDRMGDDVPPDELNHAPEAGLHFGFPYCHGGDVPDPTYGDRHDCSEFVPPARKLGPHVAALGMRFYNGDMFPAEYRHQIFIAEHGSWNRSVPIGYRVTLVRLDGDGAVSYEPFAEGWLRDGQRSGRPVDVEILPDGSLLVSDDFAGVIYRITYRSP